MANTKRVRLTSYYDIIIKLSAEEINKNIPFHLGCGLSWMVSEIPDNVIISGDRYSKVFLFHSVIPKYRPPKKEIKATIVAIKESLVNILPRECFKQLEIEVIL